MIRAVTCSVLASCGLRFTEFGGTCRGPFAIENFSNFSFRFEYIPVSVAILPRNHTKIGSFGHPRFREENLKSIGVASWCCGRVSACDQEVACSSLSRAPRRKNAGQVSHTYVYVTEQYNLLLVKGRLPCDRGADKLWSMCGWQVKNCVIPLLHTGRV